MKSKIAEILSRIMSEKHDANIKIEFKEKKDNDDKRKRD